jgi:hypothetical protein
MIRRALEITQLAMCGHLKARVELKRRRYCPPFLPRCSPCPFTFPSCQFFNRQVLHELAIRRCYQAQCSIAEWFGFTDFRFSWIILPNFFSWLHQACISHPGMTKEIKINMIFADNVAENLYSILNIRSTASAKSISKTWKLAIIPRDQPDSTSGIVGTITDRSVQTRFAGWWLLQARWS